MEFKGKLNLGKIDKARRAEFIRLLIDLMEKDRSRVRVKETHVRKGATISESSSNNKSSPKRGT